MHLFITVCFHHLNSNLVRTWCTTGVLDTGATAAVELPQECLQIVLQHSVRVLDIVIVPPGTDGEVPEYVNSLVEWREMCGICKSAVKYILGEVASALKTDCLPAVWQVAEVAQAKLKASGNAASDSEQVAAAGHALDVRPS
jgi:hypothetical protein